jgi:cold shock CspA family protein|tara:strand:+ start:1422 stop:1652 length:231 start_codon:yes stop_codon:yes gene_type:complete
MNGFQLIEEKETDEEEDVFVFSKARSRLRFPTIHQGQTMSDTMAMDRLLLGFVDAIVALVAILLVVAPKKAFADIF